MLVSKFKKTIYFISKLYLLSWSLNLISIKWKYYLAFSNIKSRVCLVNYHKIFKFLMHINLICSFFDMLGFIGGIFGLLKSAGSVIAYFFAGRAFYSSVISNLYHTESEGHDADNFNQHREVIQSNYCKFNAKFNLASFYCKIKFYFTLYENKYFYLWQDLSKNWVSFIFKNKKSFSINKYNRNFSINSFSL